VPHTGLTGVDSLLSFGRVNVLVSSLLSRVAVVSSLELGRSVWWIWDFLAWTGLTDELQRPDRCRGLLWKFSNFASRDRSNGAAHQPDRCSLVVLELLVPLRSRVGVGGCWFLGPVALQWVCGLGIG
jgi:hypothetical protein